MYIVAMEYIYCAYLESMDKCVFALSATCGRCMQTTLVYAHHIYNDVDRMLYAWFSTIY